MAKVLPSQPNLEQLKKQAKDLLKAFKNGDSSGQRQGRPFGITQRET